MTELGAFEAALQPCEAVLRQNPAQADAHNTRGVVLSKLRRFDEALASYDAALAIAPDRVDIEVNRGTALLDLKRHDEALASFDKVLARDPQNVTALVNRGNAFIRDKRFADALDNYDKALAIVPDLAAALTDRGVALAEMDRFDEALAAHERALAVEPHVVAAHVNRGNALLKLTRMEEALASYAEALALEPEHADANFNAAMTRLCNGDFREWLAAIRIPMEDEEFPVAASRLSAADVARREGFARQDRVPDRRAGPGRHHQFHALRAAGRRARRQGDPRRAASAQGRWRSTVPGVAQVFSDGEPLPQFDLYCPLLSLPLAFETELATIPANIPYVRPLEARLTEWRGRMPDRGRLRVGLCWAGSSMHLNDRNRSIALDRFASILSIPGLDFISVQKDVSETEAAVLREHGVVQLGQQFADFADSAAVVAMLDLLVSVDTSIAHLAGAMGKAVALLLPFSPDFRWLLHRSDSPWYPTARLFRQSKIGDWDGPLEQVHTELADLARRPPRVR